MLNGIQGTMHGSLGGIFAATSLAGRDLRNVWPEPKGEAKRKDQVEDVLVTAARYRHTLTLQAAQAAIRARLDCYSFRAAGGSRTTLSRKTRMMSYWVWDHDDDEGYDDGEHDDEHARGRLE